MDFDLKQTITQIIAFLIMLWVLKRYAWKPLLSLMDERTQKIAADFAEAEEANLQANILKEEYEQKISKIKEEERLILQNAIKESNRIAQDIQANAQQKGSEIITRAGEQSQRDLQKARAEFKKEMVEISFEALEKLIGIKLNSEERDRYSLQLLDEI